MINLAKPALRSAFLFLLTFLVCTPLTFAGGRLKLRVGAYDNPPKIGIEKSGKVTGFWPELISIIAAGEGWDLEYVKGDWANLLTMLEKGEIDIMPDVAFTPQRAGTFSFNKMPVLVSWSRVYVRSDDERIKSLEDLHGKRIGGLFASVNMDGPDGIKGLVQSFNLRATIVELDNYTDVFQALKDGFVDAVITNRNFGDEYIKTNPVKKTPIMLQPVSLLFAFPKDADKTVKLSSKIDYHLQSMTNDNNSVYYSLLTKYFETEIAEKTIREAPGWLRPLLITAGVLILFLFSLNILARRQVRVKTLQLQQLNDSLVERIAEETSQKLKKEQIIYEQKKFADMGQMMGAIAHQWRQPLNNIYLISQLMRDQWKDGETFGQQQSVSFSKMGEVINSLSATIDDFRSFFAPYKEKTKFNVSKTVLNCLRLFDSEFIYNKINISFRCECDDKVCEINDPVAISTCENMQIMTLGYEGEFKQIILNLLSNSKDAILETSPAYKKISISIFPENDYVTIIVEDTGGGVKEDFLPRVFDPYFSTKPEGEGIGIGLYMAKTILKNHMAGDITMENTGEGAKVTVRMKVFTE